MITRFFCRKKVDILIYALVKTIVALQYYIHIYIYNYTIIYLPGKSSKIFVMFSVGYKCANGNVFISTRALRLTAGNGPRRVFRTFLKGVMFLK